MNKCNKMDVNTKITSSILRYTQDEISLRDNAIKRFNLHIEDMQTTKTFEKHDNATILAVDVIEKCRQGIIVQLIIGLTQSGKTGAMLQVVISHVSEFKTHPKNIFIITGLSSKNWKEQTTSRFPEGTNIYHNSELKHMKEVIKGKKDVLILIDEISMAALKDNTICKIFKELGIDKDFMIENNYTFLLFSATPDGILSTIKEWSDDESALHMLEPGEGYFGSKEMLSNGQLFQSEDLFVMKEGEMRLDKKTIKFWKKIISIHLTFEDPKYLIFRIKSGHNPDDYMELMEIILDEHFEDDREKFSRSCITHFESDKENIDDHLNIKPKKHKVIFVREKLKCSTTFATKQYIGTMVDRPSLNDSCSIQSFLGRGCGYEVHCAFIYTNMDSVRSYHKLLDSTFTADVKWKSNTTKIVKGKTEPRENYASIIVDVSKQVVSHERIPVVIKLKPWSEDMEKQQKIVYILDHLDESHIKLKEFMTNNICKQISIPKSEDSYKKHITNIYKHVEGNTPTTIDLTGEDKNKNNWQAFYDHKNEKCIILVWSLNDDY